MKKITVEAVYTRVLAKLDIGVRHGQFYIKENNNSNVILQHDLAIRIRELFTNEEQQCISVACIKEVMERLTQNPSLQLHFIEERTDKYIKTSNEVFNIETGEIEDATSLNFGYYADFKYIPLSQRDLTTFSQYVKSSFPEEPEAKRQLLLEIMGYALSDCQKAKTGFFLIGESNSGKSTMLELFRMILPEHCVTSLPLSRLENRFNLARLADARVNICTELSEKSFSASDIFKMMTSNETVTAEHKGCKPFEFKLRCKSLNAGNCIPEIKNNEGFEAMLNRMVILLFPVSISKEEQDLDLLDKLWTERDSIFSEVLDALVVLRKNNFKFTEPKDTIRLKNQLAIQGNTLPQFVKERCVFETNAREHLANLYQALEDYCNENLLEMKYSKTHFSQYLCKLPQLKHGKFRLNGSKPLSGVVGIRLKNQEEYDVQDSEQYSPKHILKNTVRNIGTLEQGDTTNEQ